MKTLKDIIIGVVGAVMFLGLLSALVLLLVQIDESLRGKPVERSFYPAIDQYISPGEERLYRWLDTDTGVICYARGYSGTLSCVYLKAQRMP